MIWVIPFKGITANKHDHCEQRGCLRSPDQRQLSDGTVKGYPLVIVRAILRASACPMPGPATVA